MGAEDKANIPITPPCDEGTLIGPYDGKLTRYRFASTSKASDWTYDARTLAEAIRAFRVGVLFPHDYSDKPNPDSAVPNGVSATSVTSSLSGACVWVTVIDEAKKYPDDPDLFRRHEKVGRVVVARILPENPEMNEFSVPATIRGVLDGYASPLSTSTELVASAGPTYRARTEMEAATVAVWEKVREVEKARIELQERQRALMVEVTALQTEVKKRLEQLWVIELYLGVETIATRLRDGVPAPSGTPITLCQRVLCMDEEIAVHQWNTGQVDEIGQFDYSRLTDFDRWLRDNPSAVDQLIPHEKGVVAMRVRRNRKDRHANTFGELFLKEEEEAADRCVYLLVRNGDQLTRLWVDVNLWPRLFPRRDEWDEVMDATKETDGFSEYRREAAVEEAKAGMKTQLAGYVLIQGLIENTDLFHPLPSDTISVFSTKDVEAYFHLVRDDEGGPLLSDDDPLTELTWPQYWVWLNERMEDGVRVLWHSRDYNAHWGGGAENPLYERTGVRSVCEWPAKDEVYTLSIKEGAERYGYGNSPEWSFLYLPRDEVSVVERNVPVPGKPGWVYPTKHSYRERTRRIRFLTSASEVWPVDFISWRVLEHLMLDREKRAHYGSFMGVAWRWMRNKRRETEMERPFVDLVLKSCRVSTGDEPERARVERLVRWWKTKTKEHRSLTQDSDKAFRMVKKAYENGNDYDNDPEILLFKR